MGKVVLTQEQGDSIKRSLESNNEDSTKVLLLFIGGLLYGANSCLKKLSLEQMTKALLIGYQIEQPKFEVGEWATNTDCNQTFKVYAVTDKQIVRTEDGPLWDRGNRCRVRFYSHTFTRLATKEEIFWAELGREKNSFMEGDVIYTNNNSIFLINQARAGEDDFISVEGAGQMSIKGLYPKDSFKPFPNDDDS